MQNKTLKTPSPHSSLLPEFYLFCPSSAGRRGVRGLVSSSRIAPAIVQGEKSSPCSSMGFLPWETVLHEVLQLESIPSATVLQIMLLLYHGSLFHKVQSFRHSLLQHGLPVGSQVPPGNLLQHGLSSLHGSTGPCHPSFRHHQLWCGSPSWAAGTSLHPVLLHSCFTMGCRKISAGTPGTPPPSPSAQTLVSAELLLSLIFILLLA